MKRGKSATRGPDNTVTIARTRGCTMRMWAWDLTGIGWDGLPAPAPGQPARMELPMTRNQRANAPEQPGQREMVR